jgi:hypothetical protein
LPSLHRLFVRPAALCFALIAVGLLSVSAARAAESRPPNLLFAIADDWGVHAGAYGTKWVCTPNFDRVDRDGILFKNANTSTRTSAACSQHSMQRGLLANTLVIVTSDNGMPFPRVKSDAYDLNPSPLKIQFPSNRLHPA